jgi:hypothetical protein
VAHEDVALEADESRQQHRLLVGPAGQSLGVAGIENLVAEAARDIARAQQHEHQDDDEHAREHARDAGHDKCLRTRELHAFVPRARSRPMDNRMRAERLNGPVRARTRS